MASIEHLIPKIFHWEGGWSDNPNDKGGQTNMGVTLQTWKSQGYDKDGDGDIDVDDLKIINKDDVVAILCKYWDRWRGNEIVNQSIADFLVDWVWNSGKWGITIPQRLLKVPADGIVGPMTLNALNGANQLQLFMDLVAARKDFIDEICLEDPRQKIFRHGWYDRIDSFKFEK